MKVLALLLLSLHPLSYLRAQSAPPRPVLQHEAPASVTAGSPLKLIARVGHAGEIAAVTLHLAQSGGSAPVDLPMRPAGAGVFVVTVPPSLFAATESFRYYIEARAASGVRAETHWATVRVIGGKSMAAGEGGWKKPLLIGAGAAAAVGAGIALSGGGGGGGDEVPANPTDPADNLIVRTATDSVNSATPALPRINTVDAAAELGGRTLTRVRIRLEFDGVDGGAETYEVSYNGATVLSGSAGGLKTEQVDVLGAADTQVLIRVLSSVPVNGISSYSWNATVTYFLQ